MSTFIKFTQGTKYQYISNECLDCNEYVEGLNTCKTEWSRCAGAGGFYFTTYENAAKWVRDMPHVWDVEIPAGETKISTFESSIKSHSIIMRNMRPVRDILVGMDVATKIKIFHTYPMLMKKLKIEPTQDMFDSYAPKLINTICDTEIYDNGLHIIRSETVRGIFTKSCRYLSLPVVAGSIFQAEEFRDGHAYGQGMWYNPNGQIATGTFDRTVFSGPGTNYGSEVNFNHGQWSQPIPIKCNKHKCSKIDDSSEEEADDSVETELKNDA